MPTQGPIPVYNGNRLLGIELEFDAGNATFNLPGRLPTGWSRHADGSLYNGSEIVLEPPEAHVNAVPKIKALNDALDSTGTYAGRRGGMHVHVQVADYTIEDAVRLANLYRHFQPAINTLVAKSRVNNHFCPAYTSVVTRQTLIEKFRITTPASTRSEARCSRSYSVVNFAMMRCTNPQERTVEFRQGSTSKRADCVAGWSAFLLALTDLAKNETLWDDAMELPATMAGLRRAMLMVEEATGNQNLAEWVQWRHDYMNEEPTPQLVDEAVRRIGPRWHGMFFVSRQLNINNALAQKILEKAHEQGKLEKNGVKYRAPYAAHAENDLNELVDAMAQQEAAPQPQAAPAAA
jgi:hypothetical protein